MPKISEDLWFGHATDHGWVFLDRTWPENKPGRRSPLAFVKCIDWTVFEVPFSAWHAPAFRFFDRVPQSDQPTKTEVTALLRTYGERRETLRLERLTALNNTFLAATEQG